MATPNEVISDSRLRDAVGVTGDSEDVYLASLRLAAIDYVAKMLNRNIVDRLNVWTDEEKFFYQREMDGVDVIGWLEPDVRDVVGAGLVQYRAIGSSLYSTTAGSLVALEASPIYQSDRVMLSSGSRLFQSIMEFDMPAPRLQVNIGMAASDIPAAWSEAVALLVRCLYDGSGFDSLGKDSPIHLLLNPYKRWAFDR